MGASNINKTINEIECKLLIIEEFFNLGLKDSSKRATREHLDDLVVLHSSEATIENNEVYTVYPRRHIGPLEYVSSCGDYIVAINYDSTK